MFGVGALMEEHIVQTVRLDGGGGQVDGGPHLPHQTGGGEPVAEIHRQGTALRREGDPALAQVQPEPQVGKEEEGGHGGHTNLPHHIQHLGQGEGGGGESGVALSVGGVAF